MAGETQLHRFRQILHQHLDKRADATLNLLDALSSNTNATSVVELSLSPHFERGHDSVYAALRDFSLSVEGYGEALRAALSPADVAPFRHVSLDVTSQPRPYARTLSDRTMVYQPTVVRGNKPVTIGHSYSHLVLHPPREPDDPPWVVPLAVRRVQSEENAQQVGLEQLRALLPELPDLQGVTLCTADTAYSQPEFLLALAEMEDVVGLIRLRSNRVLYRPYRHPPGEPRPRGHPRWYGEKMKLNDRSTWLTPDREWQIPAQTHHGQERILRIRVWSEMLMRGKKGYPMHQHPFILLCYELLRPDGTAVYRHPVWLLLFGKRRHEVFPPDGVHGYFRRFDIEHFFRFCKRRLLMTRFQTPDTRTEEKWPALVQLAYLQLWLARNLAQGCWHPWQRHLATQPKRRSTWSPSQVQRDFSRIIGQLGTPARSPKRRGKSPGWRRGSKRRARLRRKVVKKTQKAV